MSSKELNTYANIDQKSIRLKGHEYKMYQGGTIVDFQKLSASLGNILESKELLSKYHPEVLKLSILSNSSQELKEFTNDDFIASEKRLYYFYQTLNSIKNFGEQNNELNDIISIHGRVIKPDIVDGIKVSFVAAMNDNLNTSLAISEFVQVFKYANALLNNANENPLHKLTSLNKIYKNILVVANLLGIFLEEPEVFILDVKEKYIKANNIDMNEIQELLIERQDAKAEKNYNLSDELKEKLDQKGILVRDSKFGSDWDFKELYT